MQYLIDRGANLEHKECQGRTLLYWTSHSGDLDILDLLLRLGADPNQTSRLGRTSLSKSAWNNKVDVIRKLLAYPSTKIDMEDDRGRTALHNAVWGATGGRTGFKQGISGLTDSPGCASALLEHGADIEHADNTGATPLFIAVTTLSPNSVRVLLDFGANVTAISHRGFMPLHEGCIRGHVETVKILIEHGVDINIESPAGYKPLHCAILSETTEILTYLLTFPDIEIDESHIEQALYSVDRLKIILEKYTTTLSQQVFYVAVKLHYKESIKFLISYQKFEVTTEILYKCVNIGSKSTLRAIAKAWNAPIPNQIFLQAATSEICARILLEFDHESLNGVVQELIKNELFTLATEILTLHPELANDISVTG